MTYALCLHIPVRFPLIFYILFMCCCMLIDIFLTVLIKTLITDYHQMGNCLTDTNSVVLLLVVL
jgi:hypothetical protein